MLRFAMIRSMFKRRLRVGRGVAALLLAITCVACGSKSSVSGTKHTQSASVKAGRLSTGLFAFNLARKAVPTATGLVRTTIAFPRDGGTAEFWTIDLSDPQRGQRLARVEIQGQKVVNLRETDPTADSIPPIAFDLIKTDSAAAAAAVAALPWAKEASIKLSASPLVLGRANGQMQARGKPVWSFVVMMTTSEGQQLIGNAWVSTESGAVVDECHDQSSPC